MRGAHETELLEHVKRVTGLEGRPGEVAAAVEGVSEMEGGDGFVGDAAPLKIGEAHVAPLVGLRQVMLHQAHRPFVGNEHGLALRLPAALLVGEFPLLHLYAVAPCQVQQSLVV